MEKKIIIIVLGIIFCFSFVSASVEHTPSTDTYCSGGICTKSLYSGVRNVYEDNQWKKVEEANSLKDKGFIVNILEDDEKYPIEVVDFNYTSITVKLNPKGIKIFTEDIPIRVWNQNETRERQFLQDVSDGKVISKGVKDYKEKMTKSLEEEIGFHLLNQEEEKTYNFPFGSLLEFGFESTTIKLQDNESENLDDCGVYEVSPDLNDGANGVFSTVVASSSGEIQRIMISFNISSIPSGSSINESTLFLYKYTEYTSIYEYNTTIYQIYSNVSWSESTATWNNQPCGTLFDISENCSLIEEETINLDGQTLVWGDWNVTNAVIKSYNISAESVSFLGKMKNETALGDNYGDRFYSKEETNISLRPYLNITYTSLEDTTPPYFDEIPANQTITYPNGFGVDFNASDETEFDSYAINWTSNFEINSSGFLQNTTTLEVATYLINVTINDSENNLNSTLFKVTVSQATTSLGFALTPSNGENFGTETTATGSNCPSQLTCELFRDDVLKSNPEIDTLGVGSYVYVYNTTGNTNYTTDSATDTLVISKISSAVNLTLNGTRGNLTIISSGSINLSGTLVTGDSQNIQLYNSSVLINNGTSVISNLSSYSTIGQFNITVIYKETENYSQSSETWWVNVLASPPGSNGTLTWNWTLSDFDNNNPEEICFSFIWGQYCINESTSTSGGGTSNVVNISDLGDVNITSVSDNDLLSYNDASKSWVNKATTLFLKWIPDSIYYYNDSTNLFFNETQLNITITDLIQPLNETMNNINSSQWIETGGDIYNRNSGNVNITNNLSVGEAIIYTKDGNMRFQI